MKNDDQVKVVIEHFDDQFARMGEILSGINDQVKQLNKRVAKIEKLSDDIPVIKMAVRKNSTDIQNNTAAIRSLEQSVARGDVALREHESKLSLLKRKIA